MSFYSLKLVLSVIRNLSLELGWRYWESLLYIVNQNLRSLRVKFQPVGQQQSRVSLNSDDASTCPVYLPQVFTTCILAAVMNIRRAFPVDIVLSRSCGHSDPPDWSQSSLFDYVGTHVVLYLTIGILAVH
jgi:hypothetical protein